MVKTNLMRSQSLHVKHLILCPILSKTEVLTNCSQAQNMKFHITPPSGNSSVLYGKTHMRKLTAPFCLQRSLNTVLKTTGC